MFGIGFAGHPYLEKLYLPTGFEGNPLRKDFPLLARHVKPWPGIVDVEPMPDEDDDDEDADATPRETTHDRGHRTQRGRTSSPTSRPRPPTPASTSSSRPTTA